MEQNPVLVTTEFRGVFFGFVKDNSKLPNEITLTNARNCLYWASSVGGFMGLASKGPDSNCNIGSKVKEITLYKITSVTPVEEGAAEKWQNA
jgi:hypothetical protein